MGSIWSQTYAVTRSYPAVNFSLQLEAGSEGNATEAVVQFPATEQEHRLYYCGLSTFKTEACSLSADEWVSAWILGFGVLLALLFACWACAEPASVYPLALPATSLQRQYIVVPHPVVPQPVVPQHGQQVSGIET